MIQVEVRHRQLFLHLGINPPKVVLLQGPPGTCKTLLAQVFASEAGAIPASAASTRRHEVSHIAGFAGKGYHHDGAPLTQWKPSSHVNDIANRLIGIRAIYRPDRPGH